MADNGRPTLKMVGTSSSNGGVFGKVSITGECEIRGDLDCELLSCTGEVAVDGGLTAGTVKLTGVCETKGNLSAGDIRGSGELTVKGGLRGEKMKLFGQVTVDGDIELGEASLRGAVVCGGLLSAERLELGLLGPSVVRELGGGRLCVRRTRIGALKSVFAQKGAASLKAETIEGDSVELQHTEAAVVRGGDVVIGPGCHIGTVEYRRELRVDAGSTVGARVRI